MIARERAAAVVPDRHGLYIALLRNQNVMPPESDAINTIKFMLGVVEGNYWMLTSNLVVYRVCADPPCRKELASILYDAMKRASLDNATQKERKAFHRTAEKVIKTPPAVNWMLICLSSIVPDHFVFARDYVKPKPVRNGKVVGKLVPAYAGFFEGLPAMPKSKKGNNLSLITKEQREELRVENMEERIQELQEKLKAEKER